MNYQPAQRQWFKSSRSEGAKACVEVCLNDQVVGIRDSKNPGGPELWFPGAAWDAFLESDIWKA
ncbi:DUF397 domain-containing protein [Nocardia sp. NBC_01388]|uniref:DUF397 domain-containing protein n=1 Tax=Nocardia sp. NBC_01388 TaxID=2903596 RepID=UPI00324EFFF7